MRIIALSIVVGLLTFSAQPAAAADKNEEKIVAAMPAKGTVAPKKKRRLLVYSKASGFRHGSIGTGKTMLRVMSEKTGAFEVVFNDNEQEFTSKYLATFDAVFFNNTTKVEKAFKDPKLREALINYVKNGGGWAGNHSSSDAGFPGWPEYTEMVGGTFDGHPWGGGGTWPMVVEDPTHPVMKSFKATFTIKDEIYKQKQYTRSNLRVLLTIDAVKSGKKGRPDGDNPVAWVRSFGKGRLFYSNLGHNHDIMWNPAVLRHYLAGIQFAMGDLEADTKPLPQPKTAQK